MTEPKLPHAYLNEVAHEILEVCSIPTPRSTKHALVVGFLKAVFTMGEASGLREGQNIYERVMNQ